MGTASAATAVTPLTAAPSLHERPTRGAIRWAHAAIRLRGHSPGAGVVDLGTQLELASDMGLSRGTVGRHLRVLGPIAVDTVPVLIDTDLLHDASADHNHRPDVLPDARATGAPDPAVNGDERLLAAATALVESVAALVDAIAARTQSGPARPTTRHRRSVVARRSATRRDDSARPVAPSVASVAFVAPVARDSQSDVLPVQYEEADCLTDLAHVARGATDRVAPSRRVAPTPTDPTDQLTSEAVTELLKPLIKTCRDCHRSDKVDRRGYATLRQLSEHELRYGISRIVTMTRQGDLRSPMHFLVAHAQKHAAGDTEFFERPDLDDPAPVMVTPTDELDHLDDLEDLEDPLDGLSAEQLAAIDAQIKGRHTMGTRALDSIRREHARQLRHQQTDGSRA